MKRWRETGRQAGDRQRDLPVVPGPAGPRKELEGPAQEPVPGPSRRELEGHASNAELQLGATPEPGPSHRELHGGGQEPVAGPSHRSPAKVRSPQNDSLSDDDQQEPSIHDKERPILEKGRDRSGDTILVESYNGDLFKIKYAKAMDTSMFFKTMINFYGAHIGDKLRLTELTSEALEDFQAWLETGEISSGLSEEELWDLANLFEFLQIREAVEKSGEHWVRFKEPIELLVMLSNAELLVPAPIRELCIRVVGVHIKKLDCTDLINDLGKRDFIDLLELDTLNCEEDQAWHILRRYVLHDVDDRADLLERSHDLVRWQRTRKGFVERELIPLFRQNDISDAALGMVKSCEYGFRHQKPPRLPAAYCLVAGGAAKHVEPEVVWPEIYNYRTARFTPTAAGLNLGSWSSFGYCQVGTKLHLVGGEMKDGIPVNHYVVVDYVSGVTERRASLPRKLTCPAIAEYQGGILCCGGSDYLGRTKRSVYWFDGEHTWEKFPPLLHRVTQAVAILHRGNVFLSGGKNKATIYRSVSMLCNETQTWMEMKPMQVGRAKHRLVDMRDGSILALGGETAFGLTAVSERFDSQSNTWSPAAPLNKPRKGFGVVWVDERPIVFAGRGKEGLECYGEYYLAEEEKWEMGAFIGTCREDFATCVMSAEDFGSYKANEYVLGEAPPHASPENPEDPEEDSETESESSHETEILSSDGHFDLEDLPSIHSDDSGSRHADDEGEGDSMEEDTEDEETSEESDEHNDPLWVPQQAEEDESSSEE